MKLYSNVYFCHYFTFLVGAVVMIVAYFGFVTRTFQFSQGGTHAIYPVQRQVTRNYSTSGQTLQVSTTNSFEMSKRTRYLCGALMGRLGNRMFQYASLVGIARMKGMIPVISQDNPLLKIFNINISTVTQQVCDSFAHRGEKRACAFDQVTLPDKMSNYTLHGYYQSWRYFENSVADLKQQYTFKKEILAKATSNLLNLTAEYRKPITWTNITIVGVHVRRGDMTNVVNIQYGYRVATRVYFRHAMNLFRTRYKQVLFVVCSNDITWSRANIPNADVVFSTAQKPEVDLAMLAMCNHTIMSVGSYGWWASWLAGGSTVYYKYQYYKYSKLAPQFNLSDYVYHSWIKMD